MHIKISQNNLLITKFNFTNILIIGYVFLLGVTNMKSNKITNYNIPNKSKLTINNNKKDIVFILSIDGGGIKGIIPSAVLKEISKRLNMLGDNRPFHKIFDLMAGTSAGGMISLALATPYYGKVNGISFANDGGMTPDEMLKLYFTRGKEIFNEKSKLFSTAKQFFNCKYKDEPIDNLFLDIFGNTRINSALTNLFITAFDMNRMKPFFFKKRKNNKYYEQDFYIRDAARATSAIPTYFTPANVYDLNNSRRHYSLIDGGVFCINPSLCAYIEARKIYPNAKKYIMLSLGT